MAGQVRCVSRPRWKVAFLQCPLTTGVWLPSYVTSG